MHTTNGAQFQDDGELHRHIGARIRKYRKYRGLTIQELADRIHKSRATVSKYETGQISLDMATLWRISTALQISAQQILDFSMVNRGPSMPSHQLSAEGLNSFHSAQYLYFYFYDGRYKRLKDGVIEVLPEKEGSERTAALTISVVTETGRNSEMYYRGSVTYSDRLIRFSFINQYNTLEEDLLYIFNPLELRDSTFGLLCGISSADMRPCAIKCLVSLTPRAYSEELKSQLLFTREELRTSRTLNMFVVDNLL